MLLHQAQLEGSSARAAFRSTRRVLITLTIAAIGIYAPVRADEAGTIVHSVTIENFAFAPARLEVHAGDAIEFTNRDFAPHTVTEDGDTWDTGELKYGVSGRIIAKQAGSVTYHCAYHPQMKGSVAVLPAKAGER